MAERHLAYDFDNCPLTRMSDNHLQFGRGVSGALGISREARRKHIYIAGKTGVGKSVLLANLILQDMRRGDGVTLVDPHGDLANRILELVPRARTRDVIFFNPHDTEHHVGLNVMADVSPERRPLVAANVVATMSHIFGLSADKTPRLLHYLRNGLLALLDAPGTTLAHLPLFYNDKTYRDEVLQRVTNPMVKHFWLVEYEDNPDRYNREALGPILNKVESFLVYEPVLNIVGQARSTIDFRSIIDEGKIFIADMSKGLLGEEPSGLLGSLIVTQLQLAAMSRADTAERDRRDHYIFIDEFQNYRTSSYETLFAEARKMHTSMTVAHQFTDQLTDNTRNAVLGTVGTMIVFQVGAQDAELFAREMAPMQLDELTELAPYTAWIKRPYAVQRRHLKTLPLPEPTRGADVRRGRIINSSRQRHARTREQVQKHLAPLLKRMC